MKPALPPLEPLSRRSVIGGSLALPLLSGAGTPGADNGQRRPAPPSVPPVGSDWSEQNPPWAYDNPEVFTSKWPTGVTIVNLAGSGSDLYSRLNSTLNAHSGRIVVRLPQGLFRLNKFRVYSNSGNVLYAFGFYFPRLQGLLGAGPDRTFVQMDANSLSAAQLSAMATLNPSDFAPLQLGMIRLDGTASSPVLLGGLTFRAADQQMITSLHPNMNVALPQPAPHTGVAIYPGSPLVCSHVRFQGAARAINSQPPFECANVGTQYGSIRYYNSEFDGRRSPDLDPLRPRRCGVVMANNETLHSMVDCWIHHSNISRYAANDQNKETRGDYSLTRCKVEQISNNLNSDPKLNNGNPLGGHTNATMLGWESCNGTITIRDCILKQDNPHPTSGTGQIPMMYQLTSVGGRNPRGGRLYSYGGEYSWVHPQLSGYVGLRVSTNTHWWSDGFNNTLFIHHPTSGNRLQHFRVTGSWPPSAAALQAAGVKPTTHYLIRSQ